MEEINQERASLCALNRIFGFEPRIALALIDCFGGGTEVFRQKQKDISEALGPYSRTRYSSGITESAFESAAIELEGLERNGCRFVGIGEPGYPKLLRDCADPPLGLYFKGISPPEEVFTDSPAVAVVGTRDLSYYGKDWCQRIVSALAKSRESPLIVSGLALGVDVTAHKTALDCGLPTVAVMATGIEDVYPVQNKAIGERIASTKGCALVSDYPPLTQAVKVNFIRRNRIIAGICRATILVESRIKGGGMMTARLACSYERELFALPGRVDDPASQGCNLLIREKMAEPIGDLSELVSQLGLGKVEIGVGEDFRSEVENQYRDSATDSESNDLVRMGMKIKERPGISIDELCGVLKWPYSKVSRCATLLECDGFISIDLLQHCSPRLRKK